MKLVVPVSKINEVLPLIKAGADEFYCGVFCEEWQKEYSRAVLFSNRAEQLSANLKSFAELKQVVSIAHRSNVRVSLTLNTTYIGEQYLMLEKYIKQALDCKIDAIIVADLGVLLTLKEINIDRDKHR